MEADTRMIQKNILFIGSMYVNSTSRGLAPEMNRLGFDWAGFMDSFGFARKFVKKYFNINFNDYIQRRKPFPLSFLFNVIPSQLKQLDYIFVEQNAFLFYNDIDVPVIYYHRDIPTDLFMTDMDVLLYRFKKMEKIVSEQYPQIWGNGIIKKRFLNGVCMELFEHDLPKIYEGINWIGWLKPFEWYFKLPKQKAYYIHVKKIVDYARKNLLINYHRMGIAYSEATRILQQSQAVLILPGTEAYVTRKIYEAAVAKTLIVLWVQNNEGQKIYDGLGLVHQKNCIMFRKKEELRELADLKGIDIGGITSEAYKWVKENHTWANRAQELAEICDSIGN